ncbi:unnamed protein product [Cunninghamella blakesleeana]
MSFQFNWPVFDNTFYNELKAHLESGLNKERNSKYIADSISVKEMNFGSSPPELEILEICELTTDYFRGIFKLTYEGDAFVTLKTKIQANPLYTPPSIINNSLFINRYFNNRMVAVHQPLFIPMELGISDIKLNGIITLSVSKTKGITLVFKNDPLDHLKVNSTFDIITILKSFLQDKIENQLRLFLQETFPIIVHDFSIRQIKDRQEQQQNKQSTNISTITSNGSLLHPLLQKDRLSNNYYYENETDDDDDDNLMTPDLYSPTPFSISDTLSISSPSSQMNDYDDLLFISTSLKNNHHQNKSLTQIYIDHMDNMMNNDYVDDDPFYFNLDRSNYNNNNTAQNINNPSIKITLPTNNNNNTMLNHMMELSTSSNTLAFLCSHNEKPTTNHHFIHKTFKPISISPSPSSSSSTSSSPNLRLSRHGKKIPKRRIWYL